MTTPPEYRIRVDLDGHGNPIGWSYEALDRDGEVASLVVGPRPDPFDTGHDALTAALSDISQRYGLWLALF